MWQAIRATAHAVAIDEGQPAFAATGPSPPARQAGARPLARVRPDAAVGPVYRQDGDFCLWHSPVHAEEVAEARRLGGLRRRRERTVSGAYDLEGLDNVPRVRRLLEIAVLDTLGLENSIARSRTLAYLTSREAGQRAEATVKEAAARWRELVAVETVIGEAAAEFDGEDPLLPDLREALHDVRIELEELVANTRKRLRDAIGRASGK